MYKFIAFNTTKVIRPVNRKVVVISGKINNPDKDITRVKLEGDGYKTFYRIVDAKGHIMYIDEWLIDGFKFVPI